MSQEAFAETVAALAEELPARHIEIWSDVLVTANAPSDEVEAALIDAGPGYAVATQTRRLMAAWRTAAPGLPGAAVALALRGAAVVRQRAAARRTELVISGPTSPLVPVRLTSAVAIEVIRAARSSLLIVSFAAYGVTEVIAELVAAATRGVHIDLILENSVDGGGTLRGSPGAATFTKLARHANFWHWPAEQRSGPGASRPALHAKIIAADTHVALIGSANLTDRALSHNLEVGVVLHDPDVVRKLVGHFAALMDPRAGPLTLSRTSSRQ